MTPWEIKGREFGNCNCAYGCPCQFNALPTHGHCRGLAVFDIEQGFHGTTRLDGLRAAGIFRWPGPIHEGKGEGVHVVDQRATLGGSFVIAGPSWKGETSSGLKSCVR